jgi:ribose transport system substrate-binding protein
MPVTFGRSWRLLTMALLTAVVLAVAACGGNDDGGGGATQEPAATATGATEAPYLAEAKTKVESLFAGEAFQEPPATSPPPQKGKTVWQISFGLALPASVLYADAIKAAAKDLGWKVRVFDAKFSPDQYQEGIRQAVAAKADGIILYNIDCNLAQAAMEEAKAANIPIVGGESLDCSYFKEGAPSLFSGQVLYTQGDFPTWAKSLGAVQADWVIATTEGKAKSIVFTQKDVQTGALVDEGFRAEFAKCTTCKVARTVQFSATDIGPKLQEKTEQAILQTPDADSVVVPYDDLMTAGIAAAINSSGRKDQLHVVSGGGYAANLALVRENQGQDAGYSASIPWEGWAAADTLNRVFAGEEGAVSGNGIGLYDLDHNLATSGDVKVPIDFVAGYKKAWAAAGG